MRPRSQDNDRATWESIVRNLVVSAFTAACFLVPAALPAQAEPLLHGHEVASALIGNTIEGTYRSCASPRKDFYELYKADGTFHGKERDCAQAGNWSTYVGKWSVEGGKFCVYPGSDRTSGCFDYEGSGEGKMVRSGSDSDTVEFVILEGNPENL
jgi:hypothetical protein